MVQVGRLRILKDVFFCDGIVRCGRFREHPPPGSCNHQKGVTVNAHRVSILRPHFHISICSFPYFLMKRVCLGATWLSHTSVLFWEMRGITERRYGDACRRGSGTDSRRTFFILGSSGATDSPVHPNPGSFKERQTLCPSRYSAHIPTSPFCHPPNLPIDVRPHCPTRVDQTPKRKRRPHSRPPLPK